MSSEPVTSEPQQRGERSSHTGSVADSEQVSIAMFSLAGPSPFGTLLLTLHGSRILSGQH